MPALTRFFTRLFTPPFEGLGWAVVAFFAMAHILFPNNDVLRGNLPGPDNYMYLTQTLDWLHGQGWFDNVQHRMNPPEGVPIHFSRLAQIPLAAGIELFLLTGLSERAAALMTALILPFLLLGTFLSVLRRTACGIVSSRWAGASAYITLFSLALLYEFMPGNVDHHGLIILLIIAALGFVFRLIDKPEDETAALSAGALLGLSMTIALETLPWFLLIATFLGLWATWHSGAAAKGGLRFALSFAATSLVGLAVTRPPAHFFDNDILAYSFTYVLLGFAILPSFAANVLLSDRPVARWSVTSALTLTSATAFLTAFPQLATGPYGAIDPLLRPILLNVVEEAKPIFQTENGGAHLFNLMSMGTIALITALFNLHTAKGPTREKWLLLTIMQGAAMALTAFYQYRFLGIEMALATLPLTALLAQGWKYIATTLQGRTKLWAELGLLLIVGPLPAVLLPALVDGRSFNSGVLLFPVEPGNTPCDMHKLAKILNNPYELGDQPHTILSQMELGPEILFRTNHSVLGGPYHMNVGGNVTAVSFLTAPSAVEALPLAQRKNIDLIVLCRSIAGMYLPAKGAPPTFIARLFQETLPPEVTRFPSAVLDNFGIFRLAPSAP